MGATIILLAILALMVIGPLLIIQYHDQVTAMLPRHAQGPPKRFTLRVAVLMWTAPLVGIAIAALIASRFLRVDPLNVLFQLAVIALFSAAQVFWRYRSSRLTTRAPSTDDRR